MHATWTLEAIVHEACDGGEQDDANQDRWRSNPEEELHPVAVEAETRAQRADASEPAAVRVEAIGWEEPQRQQHRRPSSSGARNRTARGFEP